MRPAPFTYSRPTHLEAALTDIANGATPLAGGQSLLPAMRLREREPHSIVELADIRELDDEIRFLDNSIHIGALVTHPQLMTNSALADEMPWLIEAARKLGDVQVRNLGTVLGNVCWADPRANMAIALLASEATIVIAASNGRNDHIENTVSCANFFSGFRKNVLGTRLATAIEIPRRPKTRGAYVEFARQPQDLALVNVAIVSTQTDWTIAIGGINTTPARLSSTETKFGIMEHVKAELTTEKYSPITDQHGSAQYKLELASTLMRRALAVIGSVDND